MFSYDSIQKPNRYWTKEKYQEAALKCKSRKEIEKIFNGAYNSALKHNWLDEICSHIPKRAKRKTS
jgi:hypothetical protein